MKVENCNDAKWVLNATLSSDEGDFGYSVALSFDGKTIAVGAPRYKTTTVCDGACSNSDYGEVGLVRLFRSTWDADQKKQEWKQLGDLKGFDLNGRFGDSLAISNDDTYEPYYPTIVVGAPGGKYKKYIFLLLFNLGGQSVNIIIPCRCSCQETMSILGQSVFGDGIRKKVFTALMTTTSYLKLILIALEVLLPLLMKLTL